jgi:hypothetical protein
MVHRWPDSCRGREVLQAGHGKTTQERGSIESGQTEHMMSLVSAVTIMEKQDMHQTAFNGCSAGARALVSSRTGNRRSEGLLSRVWNYFGGSRFRI